LDFANAKHLLLLMPLAAAIAIVLARQQQRLAALQREAEGLRCTTRYLESLFEQAPVGMAVFDAQLRIVRINRQLADIDGLSVEDHIGRSAHEVVPDIADHIVAAFGKVLQTGEPVAGLVFEGAIGARPDLKRAWRQSIHPVFAADGVLLGVSTTVEEITEQQRLADALRESEQRERRRAAELEGLMDAAPVALFIAHDRGCRKVTANAAGRALLRLAPGESPSMTGPGMRSFEVYQDGQAVTPDRLPLQRAAATGEETAGCRMAIGFGGDDRVEVLANAVALRDETGRVRGAASAFVCVGQA